MDRYWDECSPEEHAEFEELDYQRRKAKLRRWTNRMGHKQYMYELDKLERKVDKLERKYEQNN